MSVVYRLAKGEPWKAEWRPGDERTTFVRASGGMISPAADYVRFLPDVSQRRRVGGKRLLSPESVQAATTPKPGAPAYGFGWGVPAEGLFSHGGSDGTFAWIDKKREIIGIVFTQSPGGAIPREQFRRVVEASVYDE
ncbi:MAG: serine hydrolase domain-containing protein [Bryobacterales bacterium]